MAKLVDVGAVGASFDWEFPALRPALDPQI